MEIRYVEPDEGKRVEVRRHVVVRAGCVDMLHHLSSPDPSVPASFPHPYKAFVCSAADPAIVKQYCTVLNAVCAQPDNPRPVIPVGRTFPERRPAHYGGMELSNPIPDPLNLKNAHEVLGWPRTTALRATGPALLSLALDDHRDVWTPWSNVLQVDPFTLWKGVQHGSSLLGYIDRVRRERASQVQAFLSVRFENPQAAFSH